MRGGILMLNYIFGRRIQSAGKYLIIISFVVKYEANATIQCTTRKNALMREEFSSNVYFGRRVISYPRYYPPLIYLEFLL